MTTPSVFMLVLAGGSGSCFQGVRFPDAISKRVMVAGTLDIRTRYRNLPSEVQPLGNSPCSNLNSLSGFSLDCELYRSARESSVTARIRPVGETLQSLIPSGVNARGLPASMLC